MIPRQIFTTWIGLKDRPDFFTLDHYARFARSKESWAQFCPEWPITVLTALEALETFNDPWARETWSRGESIDRWVQLKWLYEFGGVYLDCDTELHAPLEPLCATAFGFVFHAGTADYLRRPDWVNPVIQGAAPFDPYVALLLQRCKSPDFVAEQEYAGVLEMWGWDRRDVQAQVNTTTIYPSEYRL